MPPAPQQNTPADWVFQNGPRVLFSFLQAGATSVEVFLRRDFGSRYLGLQAALVLLLVPLWATLWPGHDLGPLMLFLGVYLCMCVVARLEMLGRHLRRECQHSFYNGRPRLMRVLPKWQERTVKLYVEPLVVFVVATLIGDYNVPLCGYLLVAGCCLYLSQADLEMREKRRATEMHDAVIEQQAIVERFRAMRGES